MNILYPPSSLNSVDWKKAVFLAGSIDMGRAEDWASRGIEGAEQHIYHAPEPATS